MMTAQDVLNTYWDGVLPVKVIGIAQAMGIEVRKTVDLGGSSGEIRVVHGKPVCTISATESSVRQRFTIAHEIGHYALGHLGQNQTLFRDDPSTFSSSSYSPLERAANSFAAELLMPAHIVKYALYEKGVKTVEELASMFGVSQIAMKYRLINIGVING